MKKYVYGQRKDGVNVIDVDKMYQKICVAARIIAKVAPESITVTSRRDEGQIATYKFAHFVNATCISGRWSPGMLTNQITKKFIEPRLLIVTNPAPKLDGKAIIESSYVNVPVIAICNTDDDLRYVDCAIPANNKSAKSIAMIWYILTQEVLALTKPDSDEFKEVPPEAFVNMDCIEKKKPIETKPEKVEAGEEINDGKNEEDVGQPEEDEEDEGDKNFLEE